MKRVTLYNDLQGYEVAPGLSVAKQYRRWCVYHTQSGFYVPGTESHERRKDAARVAELITDVLDWTQPVEAFSDMTKEEGARIRTAVGNAVARARTEYLRERGYGVVRQGLLRADERGHDVLVSVSKFASTWAPRGRCARCGATLKVDSRHLGQGRVVSGDPYGGAVESDCSASEVAA